MTATDSSALDKKAARAAYQKAWREANTGYNAAYYAANRDAMRAKMADNYRAKSARYKERAAEWAKANPDKRNAINRKYRADNREIFLASNKRDWEMHKAARSASKRAYRASKPDKIKSLREAWKAAHPEACAHHVGLRRSRKAQATPSWADLAAIKEKYAEAARLRRETGKDWHVDHEIPLKHQLVCGLHVHQNLRVIPAADNQSKRNKFREVGG